MPRPIRPAVVAIVGVLVALLLLPTSASFAGSAPVRPPPPAGPAVPALDLVPAALSAPWSERVGYDATANAQVRNAVAATGSVTVVVTLMPRDLGYFAAPTPGTTPLSPPTIADRYGISASSYAALEAYFVGQGLSILHTWPDRMSLTVVGPAALVGHAFSTTLYSGTWGSREVRFASQVPRLPSPYAAEVAAVSGLADGFDTFTVPFATASTHAIPTQGRTTKFIAPVDLHVAYDLDGLYNASGTPHFASGVGIALVLWGQGYAPSDLQTFYGTYYPSEFPGVRLAPYPVDGAPQPSATAVSDPSGATQELTLDLEWSGSEAPGATLNAVYAPDGPASNGYSPSDAAMEDAINTAVQKIPGVDVVSMSFGTQDGSDLSFQVAFSSAFAAAAQSGITVLAASGDNSGMSHANCSGSADPQFPASSPQVVAVGGTALSLSLDPLGVVTGIDSEPAWNGSGGGFSSQYAAPSWQLLGSAARPIQSGGGRGIPDVAGPAADNFFYFNGGSSAGKGTSFATPMWAGMIAEMDAVRGAAFGFLTPRLYTIGAGEENRSTAMGLVDITSGSTCLGPAGTGWDTATGWGSPRAYLLYEDLVATYVTEALTTSSSDVAPGGSFTASVHVANLTNGAAIANVLVEFVLTSDGQVGLCSGTLQSASASTDPGGNASVGLGVPSCYFGSRVVVTATIASHGYFASNSTTLDVNLIGLAGFLAVIQVYPYNIVAFGLIILAAVLIGWRIGEWRHRRDRRAAPRRTAASGRPTPGPSPPPPPPGATGSTSVRPLDESDLLAPPPPPPPPSSSPAPAPEAPAAAAAAPLTLPHCPRCGAAVAFVATSCPQCGTPL